MADKQLAQWTSQLSEEELHKAEHTEAGEGKDFSEAVGQFRMIRRLAEAYDEAPPDERPDGPNNDAQSSLQEVVQMVKAIQELEFGSVTYHSTREQMTARAFQQGATWRNSIRQHIRNGGDLAEKSIEAEHLLASAKDALAQTKQVQQQAQKGEEQAEALVAKLQVLSGQVGAGKLALHYEEQAQKHANTAAKFAWGVGGAAGVMVVVGWVLFFWMPHPTGQTWADILPQLTVRVFTLGVLGYAVSFCAKAYRANTHLRYSNEHRKNALNTYILFRETAMSDQAQDIITTELVRAVFCAEETGFLDKASDKTIIEEQASLFGLLAAGRAGGK